MANIDGTDGFDILFGDIDLFGSDDDTINGFDGNDIIKPGDGDDVIDGGEGDDTLDYSFSIFAGRPTEGVIIDLNVGREFNDGYGNDAGGSNVSNVENVIGTEFNDSLTGNVDGNFFDGRGGNDFINSGGDGATLIGGKGNDTLIASGDGATLLGGTGNDTMIGSRGADTMKGGSGTDNLVGAIGNDTIKGGSGDDTITGGLDNDTLTGGHGDDVFVYADARGTNLGQDEIKDFQDDGGFFGFLNTLTGEDQLKIDVANKLSNDQVVAERNGDTLDIRIDTDGDLGTDGDRLDFASIQFASAFIVDNIDEEDLTADSDDVIFL